MFMEHVHNSCEELHLCEPCTGLCVCVPPLLVCVFVTAHTPVPHRSSSLHSGAALHTTGGRGDVSPTGTPAKLPPASLWDDIRFSDTHPTTSPLRERERENQ